jgi:hypothetical protein
VSQEFSFKKKVEKGQIACYLFREYLQYISHNKTKFLFMPTYFGIDCLDAFVNFLVVAKTHHNPVYPAVAVNHFGQPENFIFNQ